MAKMTREEHIRMQRRRGRQFIGLVVILLVVLGAISMISWAVKGVAALTDDSKRRAEYEKRLSGLVMLDPLPFDSVEQADPLLFREAAIWGIVYRDGSEPGGLDKYDRDIDTGSLILPALEVDAYITQLLGPDYQVEDGTFESNEMTYVYDEDKAGYLVPVTGQVARYYAEVESISRRSGRQIVTVGYIPASSEDLTLGAPTDPVRYMEYVFDRGEGRQWYLSALQESSLKPASSVQQNTDQPQYDLDYNPTEALQNALSGDSSVLDAGGDEAAASSQEAGDAQAEDKEAENAETEAQSNSES